MWHPAASYPDPAIQALDPRFSSLVLANAAVERLHTGTRWGEGPVWFGDGRFLLWSDVPGDRMLRWDEETGAVSTFRRPSGFANGNARDRQGRLVTCEHGARRVTRTEYDGAITVLADRFDGKRLNSPNDVAVASDGSIWFSDPTFGIASDYEGYRAAPELPTRVYRLDPRSGALTVAAEGIANPNGLCFSPDETLLYVVESGTRPRTIRRYRVEGGGLAGGEAWVDAGASGAPDGIRCDEHGNLWAGWGTGADENGVKVFAPDGTLVGRIALPERCANLCFGGRARSRLFMAAGQSLYAVYVAVRGA